MQLQLPVGLFQSPEESRPFSRFQVRHFFAEQIEAAAEDSPTSHRVHGLGVDGGVDDGDAFEFVGVVSDGLHHLAVVASQEAWLDEQTTLETTVREVADE